MPSHAAVAYLGVLINLTGNSHDFAVGMICVRFLSVPIGVVFMAGKVYAVGGFNGSLRVRTVDVYDGVKDQWTSIASMQERRSTLGAAVLSELLYAVGGFDGSTGRPWPPNKSLCSF